MYSETTGSRKTLGDVDIIYHQGIYHLFHLVLPNHDYIAHAVSNDCFHWRRVENALHIGDPGSWDDSMLWTMHVGKDPHNPGKWRMFYTGLSRRDHGLKQRIGMATSDNLYEWKKSGVNWVDRRSQLPYELPGRPPQPPYEYDELSTYPIGPDSLYYESSVDEGRHWVSWRDPFYYREHGRGWLLCAGRIKDGPIVRRGCVAVMEETSPNQFSPRPPLHHPGLYDDIEVPNLLRLKDEYYLIGSIREDAKIRYWHTSNIGKPWRSYDDNVLMASGNYAGRICHDDKGVLLWCFYTPGRDGADRTVQNLMPPPKRLVCADNGRLRVQSYEGFNERVTSTMTTDQLSPMKPARPGDQVVYGDCKTTINSSTGFQAFLFEHDVDCFRLSAQIKMIDQGKCGLVFRINRATHDGYYLSLDLTKGVAQLRSWGTGAENVGETMMQFKTLQGGYWYNPIAGTAQLQLIAHGSYIELSIDDRVILSLANQDFDRGAVGIYAESTKLEVCDLVLERLAWPMQSDEHLTVG
ncbi:glycosyl hydrolase [Rhodopirellula sp. MGV]|uniref:glycosyl hydrolase n=1 Tax=Rhodopirellula sp. MGV TaxID=2023130 RepID=UPI000B96C61E|nr:glycosyl hydrolase [Rhodopirellula sp. MGV]OYP37728.1 glycosyl hydrolase [Rhodopirellula sp. MGV]PNY37166.1 glycosyl hydrolase [Rhodopirellula baltica]